jgi:hypothetical protein
MFSRNGKLSSPSAKSDHVWRRESSGAVYPITPEVSLPGVWTSDGVMVTPAFNPADGSAADPAWSGYETGEIAPTADYSVTGQIDEIPSGAKNGSNKVFTLTESPVSINRLYVELRGTLLTKVLDYVLVDNTLTLTANVTAPAATDSFWATYFTAAEIQSAEPGPIAPVTPLGNDVLGVFTAGASLSGGRFVYVIGTTVTYANAATLVPAMGFIVQAVANADAITVYKEGILTGLTGLIAETDYFLGGNGQITAAPGTSSGIIQFVGRSISTTSLLVEIDSPILIQ